MRIFKTINLTHTVPHYQNKIEKFKFVQFCKKNFLQRKQFTYKIRLLLSWYRQHTMQVKWGTNFPSPLL